MSYFLNDAGLDLGDPEHLHLDDRDQGTEIAEGVTVERRSILWLSAAAVGAMLTGGRSLRSQQDATGDRRTAPNKLSYRQFLEETLPLAKRVVASKGEDEEAYLMTVASAMCRLADPKAPLRATMRAFHEQHSTEGQRFPLMAMSMRLEEGKGFEHHDHLDYNGVIMPIEGELRIRNYDFQGAPPPIESKQSFEVRMTSDDWLLPGRISTLGQNRDNIHDLKAGKGGARVLDVFTFFSAKAKSRMMQVATKARDTERRIFEAAWRPDQR